MEPTHIKKDYESLVEKYNLPSYKEVADNFEVDKIDKETEYVLRAVRKAMMEKIVNSLGFMEMLLTQANVPGIYLSFVKSMTQEDRQDVEKIYKTLADLSLASLDLEIDYSEKGEAELIKRALNDWNSIKPEFRRILGKIKNPNFNGLKRERSYYG